MGARSFGGVAAALALASGGCGLSAPRAFIAESTVEFHAVRLTWRGSCKTGCDLEAHAAGGRLATAFAPAGAEEATFTLPDSVEEMTPIVFKIRNTDGTDRSDWAETSYLAGLYPPGFSLSCMQMGGLVKEISLQWYPSSLADGTRLERLVVAPFADPGVPASWEDVPLPPGATGYVDARPEEWVDLAVVEYRIRSLAGAVESHPIVVTSPPGPPAPPVDVSATVDGSTIRLAWTNRSRAATAVSVVSADASWKPIATLPPLASYHVETGVPPGFHRYGVEALLEEGSEFFDGSGVVEIGALVPDPALDATFAQRGLTMPWADSAARLPDGSFALADGLRSPAWSGGVEIGAPEGGAWAVLESPVNRALARPGPLADPGGRVHAFLGPGSEKPELSTGPVVHVWRDGGAWHEEQIGYAVSLLPGQFWAAAAADGSLHVLWRSEPGIPVATYATDRGGSWIVEQVPAPALPDESVGEPLAVTPSGDAAVLLPAPAGGAPAFTLYRRAPSGWTAEAISDEPAGTTPQTLALLAPSADRATWLQACGSAASSTIDVCVRERTATGWGPSALLAAATYAIPPSLAAASPDGSRLAVVLEDDAALTTLLLVEGGATRSWSLPSAAGRPAVGFDDAGKAWVLSGLGYAAALDWPPTTYILYEER